ncbi:PqqD family protein [Paenibacillus sp. UNC499MF]|uniref:PqqD family protein n=1 Tax=Paenibacillus sp. UNC499MF TaxID=1502751 RepID=UPI00089F88F5|nr:PqqD family protein [Paenibacillus sp. UNC499MF]SEF80726.1 Coenzyme PQQ synthesis protein D (PqqD) [Paenibacillus sp. UNC499MF]
MEKRYHRHADTEIWETEGDFLIVHTLHQSITKLNEVGGYIWSLLDAPKTLEELVMELTKEYEITMDQGLNDVNVFLHDLSQYGLITTCTESLEVANN